MYSKSGTYKNPSSATEELQRATSRNLVPLSLSWGKPCRLGLSPKHANSLPYCILDPREDNSQCCEGKLASMNIGGRTERVDWM
jgi:hypothetical protein